MADVIGGGAFGAWWKVMRVLMAKCSVRILSSGSRKESWALFNLSGGLYDGELYPSLSPSTGAWSGKAVCEAEDAAGTHTKEARREE
jgi:hypothetical protein